MDIIYLLCFVSLVLLLVFMYFTMVRKNEFEERLALYRPQHQLSQKREVYLKGVHKFRLWFVGIFFVIFVAPSLIYFILMFQESTAKWYVLYPNEMIVESLIIFLIGFLAYYLLSYVFKRNEKALRMLVEQMSDSDFELLLKIKERLPFINKYDTSFVLCNHQLYFFTFFAIREIDPTKITNMNWGRSKNGVSVTLKAPKRTMIMMPQEAFSYFLQIVELYNPKLK